MTKLLLVLTLLGSCLLVGCSSLGNVEVEGENVEKRAANEKAAAAAAKSGKPSPVADLGVERMPPQTK